MYKIHANFKNVWLTFKHSDLPKLAAVDAVHVLQWHPPANRQSQ